MILEGYSNQGARLGGLSSDVLIEEERKMDNHFLIAIKLPKKSLFR
jgi:hypothetical protein